MATSQLRESVDELLKRRILSPDVFSVLMKRNAPLSECFSIIGSPDISPETEEEPSVELLNLCRDRELWFVYRAILTGDLPFKERNGEWYGCPIDFLLWAIKTKCPILELEPGYSELMRVLGYPELAISNETATETPAERISRSEAAEKYVCEYNRLNTDHLSKSAAGKRLDRLDLAVQGQGKNKTFSYIRFINAIEKMRVEFSETDDNEPKNASLSDLTTKSGRKAHI